MIASEIVLGTVATWFLLFFVVAALGAPWGIWVTRSISPATIRVSLWSGLVLLALITTVTNLFIPLRSLSAVVIILVFLTLSVLGALVVFRRCCAGADKKVFRGWRKIHPALWVLIVGFTAVSVWWIVGATRAPTNYDSGLYHIQAIWYTADFSTIPGLTNLYHSYGFSNSLNPLTAILTNGPLGLEAYRVINGFFFVVLFLEIILRLNGSVRNSVGSKILLISVPIFVAPMIGMVDYWVTSPTFDTPVAILTFVSIAALADLLTSGKMKPAAIMLALLPLALASSMRQHYWLIFAFSFVLVVWKMWRTRWRGIPVALTVTTALSALLFAAMVARDYFLSGWVMYPYKTVSFNVDWLAPDPEGLINSTKQWARSQTPAYQQVSEGWGWIRPWIGANYKSWVVIALVVLLVTAAIVMIFSRVLWRAKVLAVLLAPQLVLLATWFFLGAPHIRYVWGPILLLGILPLAWAWQGLAVRMNRPGYLLNGLTGLTGVGLIGVIAMASVIVLPDLGVSMPSVAVDEVPLNESLTLLIPEGTDQCWSNYPLCSGMPADQLAPRGELISDGFTRN